MFSYQGSLFFTVCSSDSFNRLSHRFLFVNNFFQVLSFSSRCLPPDDQDHLFCTYGFRNETSPLYPSGSQAPVCKSFLFCSCPLSDEDYLTIVSINCQRFSCFLFISCNSDNNRISGFKRNNCRIFLLLPSSFTCSR